jgi:hypothetical protein
MHLRNDGSYSFWQQQNGSERVLLVGKWGGEGYPVPELELGKPNRLVFALTGTTILAVLNGRQMGPAVTDVGTASLPVQFGIANDNGKSVVTLSISRIQVFRSVQR